MALTCSALTSELFDTIERRTIGSLNKTPFRRINCTSLEVAIDELLAHFYKRRDLPLNVRQHFETVLMRSTKIIVENVGPELVTIRLATRHERSKSRPSKYERKSRVRLDSRQTRARRPQTAAA